MSYEELNDSKKEQTIPLTNRNLLTTAEHANPIGFGNPNSTTVARGYDHAESKSDIEEYIKENKFEIENIKLIEKEDIPSLVIKTPATKQDLK